jgi:hypothetical protein
VAAALRHALPAVATQVSRANPFAADRVATVPGCNHAPLPQRPACQPRDGYELRRFPLRDWRYLPIRSWPISFTVPARSWFPTPSATKWSAAPRATRSRCSSPFGRGRPGTRVPHQLSGSSAKRRDPHTGRCQLDGLREFHRFIGRHDFSPWLRIWGSLEWTDPPFAPGHWIPEMVWLAGAIR